MERPNISIPFNIQGSELVLKKGLCESVLSIRNSDIL